MRRLIFATGNEHKMVEIREILGELPVEILSMKDIGIKADIVENGNTFEENALIKAKEVCKLAGEMVLADDSGLEIDYLNGLRTKWSGDCNGKSLFTSRRADEELWRPAAVPAYLVRHCRGRTHRSDSQERQWKDYLT